MRIPAFFLPVICVAQMVLANSILVAEPTGSVSLESEFSSPKKDLQDRHTMAIFGATVIHL